MSKVSATLLVFLSMTGFPALFAQKNRQVIKHEQCATMTRLETKFESNPSLKNIFDQQLKTFNRKVDQKNTRSQNTNEAANAKGTATTYTIPVVFHIVLPNPSVVTDAQILAQLDSLNRTYSGSNADSTGIPNYFKPLFAKSGVQFCLAQRTPDDEITTGIERITTTKNSFSASDDGMKHVELGGTNIWNGDKYFNVWVCVLADDLLGYATFPNDGFPAEQGVVIDYRSLPGGTFTNYNGGKTLTHETGHYFNLFHIWGDDDGLCSGTDYVDDTPNQANSTSGCFSGIRTDNCTTSGNGILYQNYMDYTYDKCMLLFTPLQVSRMETALLTYRSSLTTSNACVIPVTKNLDARLKSIDAPDRRICTNNFSPVITVTNKGFQTLNSLVISTVANNGTPVNFNWNGTLASRASVTLTLNAVTVGEGIHNLKIYLSSPNALTDENQSNDTLTTTLEYYAPVAAISEGFEGGTFPPTGWDITNPDQSITWKKVTGIAKTGNASMVINNFDYPIIDQRDYLRLPQINLANVDSAFFSFQVAAATYTPVSTAGNNWDTLEVLLSKDCGVSYTSLYKKWGAKLVTTATERTDSFEPTASEWRRDSINLTPYINTGNIMLAFRNIAEYENNIYLDDINLKTITINPNLKKTGFMVTPNPSDGNISVQFFPNPVNLKAVQLYNLLGQKITETVVASGQVSTAYNFDISRYPAGTYIVRAIFSDKVLTKKIVKN